MNFAQTRREVVATCVELAEKGYLAGTGGNVACRIDDEHFAVTPTAVDYYAMRPEDICVLRLDDLVQIAGDRRPSVEHRLHSHVLRVRRDCRASIHTHQPIASAYTLLGRALEIHHPHYQIILGQKAAFVGYASSGTNWLASKLRKALRPEINAYLMRNHGVICCGPTLGETVARVEALESVCAIFFRDAINYRAETDRKPSLSEVITLLVNSEDKESVQ
ncbi:MAG: class II aldolase/adducin family protein [Terracidiphilus sp.]|jgi:L-fuculose-phosphate aldolase